MDQKDTYDWAVSGDLPGPEPAAAPPAAAPVAPAEPAELRADEGEAPEPELELELAEDEAACESMAALLTIWVAVERAPMKLGREPELGARKEASGEEAAADTTLEARFAPADGLPAGRV